MAKEQMRVLCFSRCLFEFVLQPHETWLIQLPSEDREEREREGSRGLWPCNMLAKLQRQLLHRTWTQQQLLQALCLLLLFLVLLLLLLWPSHYARKRKTFNYLNYTT